MPRVTLYLCCFLAITTIARAQCQWSPGPGFPSTNGDVNAVLALPNGEVVVGGRFSAAGSVAARNIAKWSGGSWVPLGAGLTGSTIYERVYELARLPNGHIIAAGSFNMSGSTPLSHIARWDGSAWASIGTGLPNDVHSVVVMANGHLLADNYGQVFRWDGSAWSQVGTTYFGAKCLAIMENGDFVAGGSQSGSHAWEQMGCVERYQSPLWSRMIGGLGNGPFSPGWVSTLLSRPNGELVIGGRFFDGNIRRWTGSAWTTMGTGLNSEVSSLLQLPDGNLLAGGSFTMAGSAPALFVASWDGAAWSPLGAGPNSTVLDAAVFPNGDIITGGRYDPFDPTFAYDPVSRWNGSNWSAMSPGTDGVIDALFTMPNGDLVAGGRFRTIAGVSANRIARRVGSTWQPLGAGVNGQVWAITATPSGDIIAGGSFTEAGGVQANRIALWNGQEWLPLGGGVGDGDEPFVGAIRVLPNGNIVAGGRFLRAGMNTATNIAIWDGSEWTPLGQGVGQPSSWVAALEVLPSGDLIAGGYFSTPASMIARWDGLQWRPLGSGIGGGYVNSIALLAGGELAVGGYFYTAGGMSAQNIAQWNGTTWSNLGTLDIVYDLVVLPTGDLVATVSLPPAAGYTLKRWNGSTWTTFGPTFDRSPYALAVSRAGELSVGGSFGMADGQVSAYLGHIFCSCYPNCDNSTASSLLSANDFICFLTKFAAADPYANCDNSTSSPTLTANDFTCFLNAYTTGCP